MPVKFKGRRNIFLLDQLVELERLDKFLGFFSSTAVLQHQYVEFIVKLLFPTQRQS